MEKNRIIIVEGPQGTGKTSLTNYLRDNIPASNLYRLSGQKDKTNNGKEKSIIMYNALLDYLYKMQEVEMDLIFDRTFFTEEIYARLGYKEYSFTKIYLNLLKRLENLNNHYDLYLILLYLKNTDLYKQRLERAYHHNYQAFSIQNSIDQQEAYQKMAQEIKNNASPIKVLETPTDDFSYAYKKINGIFRING